MTLVVLVLFEAALRVLDMPLVDACWKADEQVWVQDPELGMKLRPNAEIGPATVNALGLRGPVLPLEKDPHVFRILFIGDSTVFGLGVPLEETFVHLATAALAMQAPGQRLEYLIGAIPGASSFQDRTLLARLLPYRPDLVVFYVGARNDAERAKYFRDAAWPERYARRSAGWHQVRSLQALEFIADSIWKEMLRRLRPRTWQARVPPDEFEANMAAMLAETLRAGASAVVLVPPYADSFEKHLKILHLYREILRESAVASGAPYVELQEVFAGHDESTVYLEDKVHPTAAGHRLIADEIVRVVRKAGLAPHASALDYSATQRVASASSRSWNTRTCPEITSPKTLTAARIHSTSDTSAIFSQLARCARPSFVSSHIAAASNPVNSSPR